MRQVPRALAVPFKAFAHGSLYLDAQRRRPEVKQVISVLTAHTAAQIFPCMLPLWTYLLLVVLQHFGLREGLLHTVAESL